MKADYTRFTFRPRKRFTSVRLQQGRVQLDSDWNELEEITEHLERTESRDVIGIRGAPENGGGFAVEPLGTGDADFRLTNGRIYVGGLLCELQPEPLPIIGFPAATRIELPTARWTTARRRRPGRASGRGRRLAGAGWHRQDAAAVQGHEGRGQEAHAHAVAIGSWARADKNPTARRALTYMTQPELPGPPAPVAKAAPTSCTSTSGSAT